MKKKVLIVDDEPDIRELLKSRLKAARGFEVVSAEDGQSGFRTAIDEKPDLILLDVMMPVMDGPTAAILLRENEITKNIPIIFLTCLVEKGQTKWSHHEIGNNLFIAKPFDQEELLSMIDKIVGWPSGQALQ